MFSRNTKELSNKVESGNGPIVSVGIRVHTPDALLLVAVALLAPVTDVVVLDAGELDDVLLLEEFPPPQLMSPVAPIRLNRPRVPKVRRRSLSIVVDGFLFDVVDIKFSRHGCCVALTPA